MPITKQDISSAASWQHYNQLLDATNLAETVGRPQQYLGVAKHILYDISTKFSLENTGSFIDIGCGYGELTYLLMEHLYSTNIELTLVDTPDILEKIRSKFNIRNKIYFVEGYFPDNKEQIKQKYDFILAYSVLHCTDYPSNFIENAVNILAPGGKLLIGDYANVYKKGRFLSNSTGRAFEAQYRGCSVEHVPVYEDQYDFVKNANKHNLAINDDLLIATIKTYRNRGFDVYVLPQPALLPFSKTREDILIVAPNS